VPWTINAVFNDSDFKSLKEKKGDRSWEEAILEEFGLQDQNHYQPG
jgi:hypothetical protein